MDEREQDSTVISFIGRAKETIVAARAEGGPDEGDGPQGGADTPEH